MARLIWLHSSYYGRLLGPVVDTTFDVNAWAAERARALRILGVHAVTFTDVACPHDA